MQLSILPPSAALADHVLFYVARRRLPDAGPATATWVARFPAHMYSALTIVHRGELSHSLTRRRLPRSSLSGAMSVATLCEYVDQPETTVVVLKPGRLTDLCRLPASELSDRWIDTNAVFSIAEQVELDDRMAAQPTLARQIMVLEQLLEKRFAHGTGGEAERLARIVREGAWRIARMRVGELADAFGWTPRRLERRFQSGLGVTPKLFIRLARLQLALALLQRAGLAGKSSGAIASVAAQAGFSDPSHLAREVKALAGLAPSQLLAALLSPAGPAWAFAVPQDSLQPLGGQTPQTHGAASRDAILRA